MLKYPHLKEPNVLVHNCETNDVAYLLEKTPDRNKISINNIFSHYEEKDIPTYYINMTDDDKKEFDPSIIIQRCLKSDLKNLYNKFTDEEKEKVTLYYLFYRYDPSFMLDIFKSSSKWKRSTVDIDTVLNNCRDQDSIEFLKCLTIEEKKTIRNPNRILAKTTNKYIIDIYPLLFH